MTQNTYSFSEATSTVFPNSFQWFLSPHMDARLESALIPTHPSQWQKKNVKNNDKSVKLKTILPQNVMPSAFSTLCQLTNTVKGGGMEGKGYKGFKNATIL